MRTFEEAKAFAAQEHRHPSRSWYNMCQLFSRECVGASSFGASAREAFNSIPATERHRSSPPPPGSIAYYGQADAGAGHAVFVVEGGFVWSNDIIRRGAIDRVQWDVFTKSSSWGQPYRGWIDACPSGPLPISRHPGEPLTYRQDRQVYRSKMRFRQDDSDSVWNIQLALMRKGYWIGAGPTGTFGRHTLAAVAAFQGAQGWKGNRADGIPDSMTVKRLGLTWVAD